MPNVGQKVNMPHYKALYKESQEEVAALKKEVAKLRANGADEHDLAKIRAESFAAGVAAASAHYTK